jgi:glycosyltransferase involved in cell wall biosynthesis
MKIAYINADFDVPVFGTLGASVHVQEVLLAMLKRGAEVHLFATRLGDDITHDVAALQIHPLPRLANKESTSRDQQALAMNNTLRNALQRESEKGSFDLVYERQSLWSYAGMEFASEQKIASVLEVNAPLIEEQMIQRADINRSAAEDVTMRAFRSANVITAVSRELGHILAQHPSARGKIHVVPNAANPLRFRDAVPSIPKDGKFVVGFVGSLRALNGFTTLIESFSSIAQQLPSARLLLVGDGPAREHLEREWAARSLTERVQFAGAVSPEEIPGLLASMDVAIAPYPPVTRFYSSPLKLYEYMAAGLPVVASRIGQIGETIEDDVTGLLVPPGNAALFASALIRLYMQPELRRRLGSAARNAIRDHTWDQVVNYVLSCAGAPAPMPPTSFPIPAMAQVRR